MVASVLVATVLVATEGAALAETIRVNSTNDDAADTTSCTLRDAVTAARTDSAVDGCPAGSGADEILLPAGTYQRGAGPGDLFDRANERPRHEVVLTRPFYLGRYEVTNAQMRRFRPGHDSGTFYRATSLSLNDDDLPAVDVGWDDASAFCGKGIRACFAETAASAGDDDDLVGET